MLEEVFNANVRDREIREISCHFAPIFRGDHPVHLGIWGKTGTGKTMTISFFLKLLTELARERKVPLRHKQLDLSTPRPCFRALNDLAFLLHRHGQATRIPPASAGPKQPASIMVPHRSPCTHTRGTGWPMYGYVSPGCPIAAWIPPSRRAGR